MQHHRLFAAGLAAALLLGAAAPALAGPGKAKGKATAPGQTKAKPNKPAEKPNKPAEKPNKPAEKPKKAKKTKAGVSGGGTVENGSFSIQARLRSPSKGHFNYTSTNGAFKVRCRGFEPYDPTTVAAAYPRSVSVTFTNCKITGQAPGGTLVVAVTDNGEPAGTDGKPGVTPLVPVAPDAMSFSMPGPAAADGTPTTTSYGGNLTDGNVKVR